MNNLVKISEETIKEIIAKYYGIRTDNVCLYHDYKFTLKNEDKVREDFIYGIVEDIEAPPPAQPDWDEMIVICDCCGHTIHVKRQYGERKERDGKDE